MEIMSVAEKVSKNYDEIVAGDNMTLNGNDIEYLKKMFIEQDEIKEIITSELLDINTKKNITSINEILKSYQIKSFYELKCQENIIHAELKTQEEKVESLLHMQEEKVHKSLEEWEIEISNALLEIKRLLSICSSRTPIL
jgi:hypothetical protein